jgi:hypothetical protein
VYALCVKICVLRFWSPWTLTANNNNNSIPFIRVLDNSHKSQLQPSTKQQYKKYVITYKGYEDKIQILEETNRNTVMYTT